MIQRLSLSFIPSRQFLVVSLLFYYKETLHVVLVEKCAPVGLSGRKFLISVADTFCYDTYCADPLYKYILLLINFKKDGCVAAFSASHARASWSIGAEMGGMWGPFNIYR